MDPRQSIRQARDAGLAPPGKSAPPADPGPPPPPRGAVSRSDPVSPGQQTPSRVPVAKEARPAKKKVEGKPASSSSIDHERLPGTARGNRQIVVVNLPRGAYALAVNRGPSLGEAVLDAVEASYAWLVETFAAPEEFDTSRLFVRHRRPQARRGLENPRATQLSFDPADVQVLDELRLRLHMSMSELVTTALERAFGPEDAPVLIGEPSAAPPKEPVPTSTHSA